MIKFLETNSKNISPEIFIEKFSDKKILVIGAGPSANCVSWDSIEYDSIVTTTHFYLNDTVRNLSNISHITLSEIIDFNDSRLYDFLDKNQSCTIAFEPVSGRPFYSSETFLKFEERYRDRVVYYNTQFGKKEGVAGRLAYFVMSFNPSELYYVGIDGKSKNVKNDPIGSFRKIQGDTDGYSYDEFKESHMEMAKHLHEYSLQNGCRLYNLGESFDFNCSGEYSIKNFPLTDNIKKIINKEN